MGDQRRLETNYMFIQWKNGEGLYTQKFAKSS